MNCSSRLVFYKTRHPNWKHLSLATPSNSLCHINCAKSKECIFIPSLKERVFASSSPFENLPTSLSTGQCLSLQESLPELSPGRQTLVLAALERRHGKYSVIFEGILANWPGEKALALKRKPPLSSKSPCAGRESPARMRRRQSVLLEREIPGNVQVMIRTPHQGDDWATASKTLQRPALFLVSVQEGGHRYFDLRRNSSTRVNYHPASFTLDRQRRISPRRRKVQNSSMERVWWKRLLPLGKENCSSFM